MVVLQGIENLVSANGDDASSLRFTQRGERLGCVGDGVGSLAGRGETARAIQPRHSASV